MADADGILLLSTKVDLSGANELAGGVSSAMARVIAAQDAVKANSLNLKQTYVELGAAAAGGSSQAAAAIASEQATLQQSKIELELAKQAYDALTESQDVNTTSTIRNSAATSAGISERMAAAASLRVLEGNFQGSTRAASAFLATTLGLGPILQVAFPVIGALALIEILGRIPQAFDKIEDSIAGWDKAREKAFKDAIVEADELLNAYSRFSKIESEHLVPPELIGPAKIDAEVSALGSYQAVLGRVQDQLNRVKAAADAAQEKLTIVKTIQTPEGQVPIEVPTPAFAAPDSGRIREQVDKQLQMLNDTLREAAVKYKQPIPVPLEINWQTSTDTVEKQLQDVLDGVRKQIKTLSETQESTTLAIAGKKPIAGAEEAKEEVAAGEARLSARKKVDDAAVALDEEMQKHLLSTGQITQAQEISALEIDSKRKLDIQAQYLQSVDALRAKQDVAEGKKPELDPAIISNLGEIQALKAKAQADDIAGADAVRNANLKALTETISAQIEQIRAVPAANIKAEVEADQEILALRKTLYADISAEGAASTEQGRAAFRAMEDAQRALGEAQKKASNEATAIQLENLGRIATAEVKASEQAAKRADDDIARQAKLAEVLQAETYKQQMGQPFQTGGSKISEAQANADALLEIARNEAAQEATIAHALAQQEIQSKTAAMQAYQAAYSAGGADADKYKEKAQEIERQITEIADQEATKRTQILDKESEQEAKIQQQLLQTYLQVKQQEEAAITGFVTSATSDLNNFAVTIATTVGEVNGKISETRYIQEQFNRMFIEIERQFYQMIMKMIEDTSAFKAMENSVKGVFDSAFKAVGLIKVPPPQPAGIPGLAGGVPLQGGQIPGAATGTAQQTAANGALTEFTTALHTASAALAQNHSSIQSATDATRSDTSATQASTGATHGDVSATQLSTGATHSDVAATQLSTGATHTDVVATTVSTGSTTTNTAAVSSSTAAHAFHTPAVLVDAGAFISHEASVIADTIAMIAHKIASLFTGAQTGGLIQGPGTGTSDSIHMAVSHGEYIVKAAAVAQPGVLPMLHAINTGSVSGGKLQGPKAATGGLMDTAEYDNRVAAAMGGGGGDEGGGGSGGSPQFNSESAFHYHAGPVSALDQAGVGDVLNRNRGELTKIFHTAVKRGQIDIRQLLRRH